MLLSERLASRMFYVIENKSLVLQSIIYFSEQITVCAKVLFLLRSKILSVLCEIGRDFASEALGASHLKHIDLYAL